MSGRTHLRPLSGAGHNGKDSVGPKALGRTLSIRGPRSVLETFRSAPLQIRWSKGIVRLVKAQATLTGQEAGAPARRSGETQ
jgi:hypothetical protein